MFKLQSQTFRLSSFWDTGFVDTFFVSLKADMLTQHPFPDEVMVLYKDDQGFSQTMSMTREALHYTR